MLHNIPEKIPQNAFWA